MRRESTLLYLSGVAGVASCTCPNGHVRTPPPLCEGKKGNHTWTDGRMNGCGTLIFTGTGWCYRQVEYVELGVD